MSKHSPAATGRHRTAKPASGQRMDKTAPGKRTDRTVPGHRTMGQNARTLWRMWSFTSAWKGRFITGVVLGSTQPFVSPLLQSWLLAGVVGAIATGDRGTFLHTLLTVSIAMAVTMLVYPWCFYQIYATFSRATGAARKAVFERLQHVPVAYMDTHFSGDLSARMTGDLNDATQLFGYPTVGQYNPFAQALSILVLAGVMLSVDPWLGALSIGASTVGLLVTVRISSTIATADRGVKKALADTVQTMIDMLAGTTLVRLYGLTGHMERRYREQTDVVLGESMRSVRRRSLLGATVDLHLSLCYLAIIGTGLWMAGNGWVTIPEVVFLATLQGSIGYAMSSVTRSFSRLQRYLVAAERVFEVLDAPSEPERPDLADPDPAAAWAVSLEQVGFRYETSADAVFTSLDLRVANGERLAIVGGSGGGKSTLLRLLLGFDAPGQGDVRLFGHPIGDYSLRTLRMQSAHVPQDCYLFDGTIRENIAWGRPDASEAEIRQAAADAYLTAFIGSLADGFDTRVGERGVQLSGGQRQRLAIARALLRNAPLLLLDEATSALDSESEHEVQLALERLMHGRTTILIAHRLSTVADADRIVVLEKGAIVEEGTHAALLAQNGRYRQLYELQFAD